MISYYLLGQAYVLLGELLQALTHFRAALGIAEQTGTLFQPGALLWIAETEARLGEVNHAVGHVQQYHALIHRIGSTRADDRSRLGRVANFMSALNCLIGDPRAGVEAARDAIGSEDS